MKLVLRSPDYEVDPEAWGDWLKLAEAIARGDVQSAMLRLEWADPITFNRQIIIEPRLQ